MSNNRNSKGQFVKGYTPATAFKKGHKLSDASIRKRNKTNTGHFSSRKGKKCSAETIKKMSGRNNHNWRGGISFEPYGLEFDENLKEVIRNRDRRKCRICGKTELENKVKLTVHHINYDKQNSNPNNLISLCRKCHSKTNNSRSYWIKYFNNLLKQF